MIASVEGTREHERDLEPEDRRIRLTSRLLAACFALLVVAVVAGLFVTPDPLDVLVVVLLALVAAAATLHVQALSDRERQRYAEGESVARLVRGLARSISPDAIVAAIAGELAPGADADHVVVIRVRDEPAGLDATLVSTRPGVPNATTQLPLSDLEDPGEAAPRARPLRAVPVRAEVAAATAAGSGAPVAIAGRLGLVDGAVSMLRAMPSLGRSLRIGLVSGDRDLGDPRDLGGRDRRSDGDRRTIAGDSPRGRVARASGRRRAERDRRQRIADRLAERSASAFGLRSTLAAPLVVEGAVAGALVLSRRTSAPWPPSSRRRLEEAATEASVALERARSYQAAEARASTDALTGLPNRRYFDEFCGLLARRRRSGDAVGVLMIDIDHFKLLNDRHGHTVGDEVLRAVGAALVATVRDDDVPARYGGEEFVVLLRNPSREVAFEIGERVRRAVSELDLTAVGVTGITVSVGVAIQRSSDEAVGDIVAEADRAMYRAKRGGRDRVVAA